MYTDYVMIDYENIQRPNLERFWTGETKVKVMLFVGAAKNQQCIPTDLAEALHQLKDDAEYVRVTRSEPEALDFHIAYYIGRLSLEQPEARFHIVSNDKGFDALTDHLRGKHGVEVIVHRQEPETPPLAKKPDEPAATQQPATTPMLPTMKSTDERTEYVISKLKQKNASRPKKRDTLITHIGIHFFKRTITDPEVAAVIDAMKKRSFIGIDGNGKVTYKS